VYKKPVLCFPIQDHVEQVLNAYAIRNVAMIGKDVSVKKVKSKLKEFIKKLPELKKKTVKYDLKNGGSKELVNVIKVALEH